MSGPDQESASCQITSLCWPQPGQAFFYADIGKKTNALTLLGGTLGRTKLFVSTWPIFDVHLAGFPAKAGPYREVLRSCCEVALHSSTMEQTQEKPRRAILIPCLIIE